MRYGDDEEAVPCQLMFRCWMDEAKAYLFESSAIPANALYQAKNAASRAKKPPALMIGVFGFPAASRCR